MDFKMDNSTIKDLKKLAQDEAKRAMAIKQAQGFIIESQIKVAFGPELEWKKETFDKAMDYLGLWYKDPYLLIEVMMDGHLVDTPYNRYMMKLEENQDGI